MNPASQEEEEDEGDQDGPERHHGDEGAGESAVAAQVVPLDVAGQPGEDALLAVQTQSPQAPL